MRDFVCFHLITEPNAYLSNWYPWPFEVDGMRYCCAEQYIMRSKAVLFGDPVMDERIMATEDPAQMQLLGRNVQGFDDDIWCGKRQAIACRGLRAKFSQNPILLERLLGTGDDILAECANSDYAWGIGRRMTDSGRFEARNWPGKNQLGFGLMIVRDELRERCAGAERKMPLLNAFAERLEAGALYGGWKAIEIAVTPEELRSFGLLMDRGSSFGKVCGLRLDDYRGFELAKDHIDDSLVLGSAVFSQWHRLTSSRTVNAAHDDVRWFSQAARRLREITE